MRPPRPCEADAKREVVVLFRRSSRGEGRSEPTTVEIHGRPLLCQVCGHNTFWRREAQLHTPWFTFFNIEWLGKTATCAVCAGCGYVHWFLPPDARR